MLREYWFQLENTDKARWKISQNLLQIFSIMFSLFFFFFTSFFLNFVKIEWVQLLNLKRIPCNLQHSFPYIILLFMRGKVEKKGRSTFNFLVSLKKKKSHKLKEKVTRHGSMPFFPPSSLPFSQLSFES